MRSRLVAVTALALCALPAGAGTLEQAVGRAMAEAMRAQYGVLDVPLLQEWVSEVGAQVVAVSPRARMPYSFTILDSPEANAFALPGGYIFVTAGLLERASSEDEIAGVMAHEAAHLANRDFQRVFTRATLFYLLGAILRHNDYSALEQVTSLVAMLNLLDHSRKREAQADAVGVELAVDAGYDPNGLKAFLGTGGGSWSYLETILSTHPHPARREGWITDHVARLEAEQPARMLRVAHSLAQRGRCAAAQELLTHLSLEGEAATERLVLLGEVALTRGEAQQAVEHFRAALAQAPSHERARAGLAAAQGMVTPAAPHWPGLAPEMSAALTTARTQVNELASGADKCDQRAWRHLRQLWDCYELNRALEMAQVYRPEVTDPAYLALLGQTWDLLAQVMRGANLVGRSLKMRREVTTGLAALTQQVPRTLPLTPAGTQTLLQVARELTDRAPELASEVCAAAASLEGAARDYEQAGRQVAPLFVQLLLAGEGEPGGRLVFSRFAVLQAQVGLARLQVHRAHQRTLAAAGVQWQAHATLQRLTLNLLGTSGRPSPALQLRLAARRLRVDETTVRSRWEDAGGLGEAAWVLTCQALELESDQMHPAFSTRLRALDIVLRMLTVEIKEEQD